MKKNKRKDKKGAAKVASIEASVQAVQEEKRLLGAPIKESKDLFVEDRSGQEQIRNRLGVKKELTIDRILRPSSNIFVPKQRIVSTKRKAVVQKPSRQTSAKSVKAIQEHQAFDIWGQVDNLQNQSSKTCKQSKVKPDTQLYSYRPRLQEHVDKLLEIETAIEERLEKRLIVPIVYEEQLTEVETMEDRANRDLVEGGTLGTDATLTEQSDLLDSQVEKENDIKKKTRRDRNKDRDERIARENRMRQQAHKSLVTDINLVKLHAKSLRQGQAAEEILQRMALIEKPARQDTRHITIPLLPEEVPESLRALPSNHSNPITEQYRRLTAH